MRLTYQHDDTAYAITLERAGDAYRVTIDGRAHTVRAERLADGGLRLITDAGQVIAYAAAQGERRYVQVAGEAHTFTLRDERTRRRGGAAAGSAAGRITAQMPGQVRQVLAAAGDVVQRGQTLLILEAMKMELKVTAPADGTIQRVAVREGDVVARDQVLAELE